MVILWRATGIPGGGAALAACLVLLAGCGGDSGEPQPMVTSPPVTFPPAGPELGRPTPVGAIELNVTDPLGHGLAGASVTVFNATQSAILATGTTDADGSILFERLPGPVRLFASHALGYGMVDSVAIDPALRRRVDVVIQPRMPVTLALLSATIPAAGVSADRSQLDLTLRVAASARAPFQPSSYPMAGQGPAQAPYLSLTRCSIRLNGAAAPAICKLDPYSTVPMTAYAYQPGSRPDPEPSPSAYAATLLLEHGPRTAEFDPASLRWLAAWHFVNGIRSPASGPSDLVSIAGFAGNVPGQDWAPLLLPLPLWTQPFGLMAFQPGTAAQMEAIGTLAATAAPPGVRAPVIEALRAVYSIIGDYAPATHRAAVVALLGGGDDAGRDEAQRRAQQLVLRREQDDAGVQTILVAGQLEEGSTERAAIADLAAALQAPLIYAGFPWKRVNPEVGAVHDGLYAALGLASELLAGDPVPTVTATFHLEAEASSPFTTGALLRGTLYLESDQCPMGCWELPVDFAVEIP